MNPSIRPWQIALAVLAVNAAGIILRYYKLDSYIVLIGFRFHISFIFPFLIIYKKDQLKFIKQLFINPHHKRTVLPLLWILLPMIVIVGAFYIINKIEVGDPDYFYEFGLSSIIDYPIYLMWNFIQVFCLFIFLAIISSSSKYAFVQISVITILVFVFEFIPLDSKYIDYQGLVSLVMISFSIGLMIKYFQNIYWFTIVVFSIFWFYFLVFGSSSEEIIHMLFASQYSGWDGFLEVKKNLSSYLLPIQLFLTFLLILISKFFRKKGSDLSF